MSTVQCPNGHASESTDYCDVCGIAMGAGASVPDAAPPAADAPDTGTCPNCSAANPANALFCEACGYDFTTGSMPRPLTPPDGAPAADAGAPAAPAAPANPSPPLTERWVAEIWIDPDWYAAQQPEDPMPSAGLPGLVVLRERSVLVGRPSASRGIHPQVDCGADTGVSRRHCQLSTDGQRWWVEDLQSSNGTYVSPAGEALPTDPIPAGQRRELGDGDRVYLGAWTRLVVRKALPGEA